MPLIVLLMVVVFSVELGCVSCPLQNFRNIGVSAAALAAVSFGQTFAILTAGLDLSVGSTSRSSASSARFVMRSHGIPAGDAGRAWQRGAAVGLVNGIVITRFKVFPFIATLAMMSIVSGLALSLSGGVAVTGVPTAFGDLAYQLILGIPVPVIMAAAVLVVASLVLPLHAPWPSHLMRSAATRKPRGCRASMSARIKIAAYVMSGICAAVGSIILTARVASGQPSLGATLPLELVAAVVLGGVSLFGGRGSIIGVAFGVLFVSILSNGLNLLNVPSYTQMMLIGAALILAVALDQAFMAGGRANEPLVTEGLEEI